MRGCLAAMLLAGAMSAQTIDRTRPPETPPLAAYRLPPFREGALANGLRYAFVEDKRFPLLTVRLAFMAGSKFDPAEQPGLAELTGDLLKEGTRTRNSRQIAEDLATIGATLNVSTSPDNLTIACSGLADHGARLFELLADVARNAKFPEDEVKLRKANRSQELLAERSQSAVLAEEEFRRIVYGSHPYSRMLPTQESIARIDRKALESYRDRMLAPNNAVLIVLGALPPEKQLLEILRERFGTWPKKDIPAFKAAAPPAPAKTLVVVDRPGSVQADIRVGRLAVPRTHADYFPLLVGQMVLGGGAASRMFDNIREKQGFAYDAHSEYGVRREAATIEAVTQVRNEVAEKALAAVYGEMKRMGSEQVSAEELTNVKNYLNGAFVIGLETQNGLANQLSMVKTMGLPNDYLEKYVSRVRNVEPDQIQAAARKYVDPEASATVVVGDASLLEPQLRSFGKPVVRKAK